MEIVMLIVRQMFLHFCCFYICLFKCFVLKVLHNNVVRDFVETCNHTEKFFDGETRSLMMQILLM